MTQPTIKDITKQDFLEYIAYINGSASGSVWSQEQAEIIGEVFCEEDLLMQVIAKISKSAPAGFTILDAFLSVAVWGFPCGREFEYRQMVKAMREME